MVKRNYTTELISMDRKRQLCLEQVTNLAKEMCRSLDEASFICFEERVNTLDLQTRQDHNLTTKKRKMDPQSHFPGDKKRRI